MNPLLKTLFCACLLSQSVYAEAAVIIQYHNVDENTPAATSVTPAQFKQHMDYLADNKFHVWALPRLIKALTIGQPVPEKVIAITFDDGYDSVYSKAFPVLLNHGFPFTVFITTGLVGGKGFMGWDTLNRLSSKGGTIANHTINHPHLIRSLSGESGLQWVTRIKHELVEAERMLDKNIGYSPRLLAYPYGEYDIRVEKIVEGLGLVAFAQHSGAFDRNVDWQAVPRFSFGAQYAEISGFIDKVNTLPMPLSDVEIRDERGHLLTDTLLPLASARPTLILTLASSDLAQRIQCFAADQGRIPLEIKNNTVTTYLESDLPVGRSRINCTAPSGQKDRFYWYSHFFIRKLKDGSWYHEQ